VPLKIECLLVNLQKLPQDAGGNTAHDGSLVLVEVLLFQVGVGLHLLFC